MNAYKEVLLKLYWQSGTLVHVRLNMGWVEEFSRVKI